MIAVLILPERSNTMFGLDEDAPACLLSLGDRPFIQHILEFLIHQGIKEFHFVLQHAPERVEALFGNGLRWGCKVTYHLATGAETTYRPLAVIPSLAEHAVLLIHTDRFPCASFAEYEGSAKPVVFVDSSETLPVWSGTALWPPGALTGRINELNREELNAVVQSMYDDGSCQTVFVPNCVGLSTPMRLLDSQLELLNRHLPAFMLGGIEKQPGVRMSRNVMAHRSIKLIPPVYIGPNTRLNEGVVLGPNAVVAGNSVIDARTNIADSLISSGTYVGQNLELQHCIVDRNVLVNARLETSLRIQEPFLLAGLESRRGPSSTKLLIQRCAALLLLLVTLPLLVAALIFGRVFKRAKLCTAEIVSLPASKEPSEWRTATLHYISAVPWGSDPESRWSHFLWRFLPGLLSVGSGAVSFIGLPPRTRDQVQALPEDWRELYLGGAAGLITENVAYGTRTQNELQAYVSDACFVAMQPHKRNWRMVCSYFGGFFSSSYLELN
jgi:NDP-sugar pyrophosphorylase family protein